MIIPLILPFIPNDIPIIPRSAVVPGLPDSGPLLPCAWNPKLGMFFAKKPGDFWGIF